jgi:outer membrane protein assembly factor BamD
MIRASVAVLAVLVVTACGNRLDPALYPTPEALFDASMSAFRAGNCGVARQGFQRLTFELPPRDQRHAEVRYYLAECMLDQNEELEAARQFRRVADEFPRHRLAPDALLRAGDAYAELWRDPELDPTYGETAVATYAELLGRFPSTPGADRAQLRITELNEKFAEKAYKAGVFYLRLRAFDSAIIYFKDVVAKYPQSGYAPRAVVRLIEAYDRIGYQDDQQAMCLHLQQYYPGTEGAGEACQREISGIG